MIHIKHGQMVLVDMSPVKIQLQLFMKILNNIKIKILAESAKVLINRFKNHNHQII